MLSDYKNEIDKQSLMAAADEKQDKIILYNEIIDVLKCIYFIFLYKHNKLEDMHAENKGLVKLPGITAT